MAAKDDIYTVSGNPFADKLTGRQHAVMPGDNAIRAVNQCGIGKTKFPNVRGELARLYTPKRPGVTGERGRSRQNLERAVFGLPRRVRSIRLHPALA